MEKDTPNVHTPPEGHAPASPADPQHVHEHLQDDLDDAFNEEEGSKKSN